MSNSVIKKFTIYQWMQQLQLHNFQDFLEALRTYQPRNLGKLESSFTGFERPLKGSKPMAAWFSSSGVELHDIDSMSLNELGGPRDMLLLSHYHETKVILGPYVKRQIAKEAERLSNSYGRPLARRELQEIKSEILTRLMPHAQTRTVATPMLFTGTGYLIVGGHGKSAETACSLLRVVLGTLPIALVNPKRAIHSALTGLVKKEIRIQTGVDDLDDEQLFKVVKDFQIQSSQGGKCRFDGIDFNGGLDQFIENEQGSVSHACMSYKDYIDFKLDAAGRVSGVKIHTIYSEGEESTTEDQDTVDAEYGDAYVELSHVAELVDQLVAHVFEGAQEVVDPEGDGNRDGILNVLSYVTRSEDTEDGEEVE